MQHNILNYDLGVPIDSPENRQKFANWYATSILGKDNPMEPWYVTRYLQYQPTPFFIVASVGLLLWILANNVVHREWLTAVGFFLLVIFSFLGNKTRKIQKAYKQWLK